jgi:hypothetical protein
MTRQTARVLTRRVAWLIAIQWTCNTSVALCTILTGIGRVRHWVAIEHNATCSDRVALHQTHVIAAYQRIATVCSARETRIRVALDRASHMLTAALAIDYLLARTAVDLVFGQRRRMDARSVLVFLLATSRRRWGNRIVAWVGTCVATAVVLHVADLSARWTAAEMARMLLCTIDQSVQSVCWRVLTCFHASASASRPAAVAV